MKRSEAINTFDQGLLMDLNPMVTPNNVVTNCLNGTLITYNGNENVLQNDMGNGRVETAYLPEGYVPLGTAELGGIIYIVSYNPLTDKCQIGSFPSPERNITQDELPSASVSIQNGQFQDGRKVSNTIVKVKLLTNPESEDGTYKLNPGDKFAIYSTNNGVENNQATISDVNTGITKVDSTPRYVTIHVVSIGEDGKITYLDDYLKWDSKLHYYIKDCQGTEGVKKDLDDYRSLVSSAYNIFNGKVSGELALLFELKTIDSFSITWDAEVSDTEDKDKNKEATVTFDVNWTSEHTDINPSNIVLSTSTHSEDFSDSDISVKQDDVCDIVFEGQRSNDGLDEAVKVDVGTFKYSSENALSKYIWNYEVTPAMPFGELDYLAVKGTINFAEIGSGKIFLDEWRYYIQENGFYLNWGLSAYPEKNKKIKKVTFTFIPFEQADANIKVSDDAEYTQDDGFPQYVVKDRNSYSGNFQEIINFGESSKIIGGTIDPNYLYLVDICVKYGKNSDDKDDKNIHTYRWLYTTGQWNNKFLQEDVDDFNTLPLTDAFGFESKFKSKDNITPQIFTNYPSLSLDNDPGDGGEYSSMGIKTIAVNYNKDSKNFKTNEANVELQVEVSPDKYSELFSFDDQVSGAQYSNTVSDRSISHSEIKVSSDKTSGISDRVESLFMEPTEHEGSDPTWDFPSNFGTTVDTAINKPISKTINETLKDSFDASITSGANSNKINLCVRGALFSRINADMVSKMMSIGQRVRPILYNSDDYDSLGFDSNGSLKFYFKEGHKDLGGNKPFCFKFGQWTLDGYTEVQQNQSSKKYWNPSDSFTRNTYWDNTKPYDDWLNPWMKAAQGPFQILQYGAYMGDVKFEDYPSSWLKNKYGLWVKTNNGHFMPVNAFWDSDTDKTLISDQLRAILMQIYYVETDVTPVSKYIVDNINVLDTYSETWNVSVKSNLVVQNMDNAIKLKYSNTKISLTELQNKLKGIEKDGEKVVNISNITYGEQSSISAESGLFSHTFRITMNDLYAIYETNKSTSIPAIYDISTKEGSEVGAAVNANNLYVYKKGYGSQPGVLAKLSKQNSSNIYPDGTVKTVGNSDGNPGKLVLTTSGDPKDSLDICNMFILKDGDLCLDEDRLLANPVSFFYDTQEGARYKGNSKYEFIAGKKGNQ